MKAITLFDPWATLVVLGEKQFETRSWKINHRGQLAIHVSKKFTVEMHELWDCWAIGLCESGKRQQPLCPALSAPGLWPPAFGCIIGSVEVVDCLPSNPSMWPFTYSGKEAAFGDFTPGRFMWQLRFPQRLAAPIPCKGMMGLWTVPPSIEAQMEVVGP